MIVMTLKPNRSVIYGIIRSLLTYLVLSAMKIIMNIITPY